MNPAKKFAPAICRAIGALAVSAVTMPATAGGFYFGPSGSFGPGGLNNIIDTGALASVSGGGNPAITAPSLSAAGPMAGVLSHFAEQAGASVLAPRSGSAVVIPAVDDVGARPAE